MKSLIHEISEAFAEQSPPPSEELLHPNCMDDGDIKDFYGGVRWEDMTEAMIASNYAAPTFFSAQAFRYYLPAYLIWTLNNLDSVEYVGESILHALNPDAAGEIHHDFMKSKYSFFAPSHIAVIKKFLWRVSKDRELGQFADQALVQYWIDA